VRRILGTRGDRVDAGPPPGSRGRIGVHGLAPHVGNETTGHSRVVDGFAAVTVRDWEVRSGTPGKQARRWARGKRLAEEFVKSRRIIDSLTGLWPDD